MNFVHHHAGRDKNLTGLVVVALLHIALLAAFLHGSKLTIFKVPPSVVELTPTPEPTPPKVIPVDVPPPALVQPQILVPPVEIPIAPATQATVTAHPMTDQAPPAQGPAGTLAGTGPGGPAAMPAPVRVAAVVDARACTKPEYPKSSLRNGDTGVVTLTLLVGTDGRVADSKVEKSSGFRELDRAAQQALSLCKFKPGTVDGVPYQSWTRMQYLWSLDD